MAVCLRILCIVNKISGVSEMHQAGWTLPIFLFIFARNAFLGCVRKYRMLQKNSEWVEMEEKDVAFFGFYDIMI